MRFHGKRILEVLLVCVVASLVAGQLLGSPVLFGFVTSGSMAPTLDPGDGFVAVPQAVAGPVEPGDVVTFRAEALHGGGLTTHRVVGETEHGYITRGDANPFDDQDGDEPPVKRAQIVSQALRLGGNVVVIPHLGTAVETIRGGIGLLQSHLAVLFGTPALLGSYGLVYLFFGSTVVYYVVGEYRDETTKDRTNPRPRVPGRDTGLDPRLVLAAFAVVLITAATVTMALPAGANQFGIVSSESDSPRPNVVPLGESTDVTYRVPNAGVVPAVVFLEPGSDAIEVTPHELHLGPSETADATLTLHAPPETGYYRYYVTEHRYLALLPTSTIRSLYEVHPWLPVVVIDATIAGAFLALTLPFVGRGRIRDRSRDGPRRGLLSRLVR